MSIRDHCIAVNARFSKVPRENQGASKNIYGTTPITDYRGLITIPGLSMPLFFGTGQCHGGCWLCSVTNRRIFVARYSPRVAFVTTHFGEKTS